MGLRLLFVGLGLEASYSGFRVWVYGFVLWFLVEEFKVRLQIHISPEGNTTERQGR